MVYSGFSFYKCQVGIYSCLIWPILLDVIQGILRTTNCATTDYNDFGYISTLPINVSVWERYA